jgi:hypothetical protein
MAKELEMTRPIFLLLMFSLLTACAADPVRITSQQAQPWQPSAIVLAPTQFLFALEGHGLEQMFEAGDAVGFTTHTGGFVHQPGAGGYVRSKEVTIEQHAEYRARVDRWTQNRVGRALSAAKITWRPLETATTLNVPKPLRSELLTEESSDGKDDVNMPYLEFAPAERWGSPPLSSLVPSQGASEDAVLVPTVLYYYAHNGGWFVGQEWGCVAGARFRLLLALYRVRDGLLISSHDLEARELIENAFNPDRTAIERVLRALEGKMTVAVTKALR